MKIKLTVLDFSVIAALLSYAASATVTPICLLAMAAELNFNLSASGGIEGMRSTPQPLLMRPFWVQASLSVLRAVFWKV